MERRGRSCRVELEKARLLSIQEVGAGEMLSVEWALVGNVYERGVGSQKVSSKQRSWNICEGETPKKTAAVYAEGDFLRTKSVDIGTIGCDERKGCVWMLPLLS